jgi:Mce-associated membrane protein
MGRWTTRVAAVVVVLAAVGFVALSGFAGYLWWDHTQTVAAARTAEELPPKAAEQIPDVLGFDFQTVLATREKAYLMMTKDFKQQFEDQTTRDVIPSARDRQVISQINVVGVGILDAHRDSGSVMVFMNRVITDKTKQPVYDGSRLKVDYQRVDGEWKIAGITPI